MTGKAAASGLSRDNNVALVLVSHSKALADAVAVLAKQMAGESVAIVCAAGAGEDGETLGTDAMAVSQAIESLNRPAGVVVLMDLGSALLSTDLALELLPPEVRENVRLTGCAFVEGAVAAATRAAAGASADEVLQEAQAALFPKQNHLGEQSVVVASPDEAEQKADASGKAVISDPNGLHARPAARIATVAGSFDAKISIRDETRKTGPVSARSLVALSGLGARHNDTLAVSASGPEAQQAVDALCRLISELTGTSGEPALTTASRPASSSSHAIPVSGGFAVGPAVYFNRALPPIPDNKAEDAAVETGNLKRAIAAARKAIAAAMDGGMSADILSIQLALLDDPATVGKATAFIERDRLNAAAAWAKAIDAAAAVYAGLDDPYLKARETDVRDVGRSVLKVLLGAASVRLPDGKPCVVIADDLAPSEASQFDPARILGVVDRRGGPTSHASILLRAAGIPAVAGAAALVPESGVTVIGFDGSSGDIRVDPDAAVIREMEEKRAEWQQAHQTSAGDAVGKVITSDGHEVELWANVSGVADARSARKAGAVGIGLLRTEMLFLDRADAPTEDEQLASLRAIFDVFSGCPIVVRTLDAGGDKQIPYLKMDREANPYLGVRGVRLCLENEPLFLMQLRAILRAGHGHDVRIMIPMIADVDEIEKTRTLLEKAHRSLAAEEADHLWPVPLGIMVEVPGTAVSAERFAAHSDFFSIGTNDLTQYTLAAERGHPRLGKFADAANPAVLKLICDVVEAGRKHDRSVSVCGEAAGNVKTAPLLVGLGVEHLSMGAASIAPIRKLMKESSFGKWQKEAQKASE